MRHAFRFMLQLAVLSFGVMTGAHAADTAYAVAYIEALPADEGKVAALLGEHAVESRKEEGNLQFLVLRRVGQSAHFAVLEAWNDTQVQQAHSESARTRAFYDRMKPLLRAPYDERPYQALEVGTGAAGGQGTLYVLTHVDIIGKFLKEGVDAAKQIALTSRADKGNLRFDLLTLNGRPNHVTIFEAWSGREAMNAHWSAAHTKAYREKYHPMSGSLYDERIYEALGK